VAPLPVTGLYLYTPRERRLPNTAVDCISVNCFLEKGRGKAVSRDITTRKCHSRFRASTSQLPGSRSKISRKTPNHVIDKIGGKVLLEMR